VAEPMSYSVDTRLVKCADCGWEGRVMDCKFGHEPLAEGKRYAGEYTEENVAGMLYCPKCNSKNLIMLDMDFAIV